MALIDCVECGAQISDKASACPKCGHPVATTLAQPNRVYEPPKPEYEPPPAKTGGGWFKWVLIVPAVLFGVVMCIGSISGPGTGSMTSAEYESRKHECVTAMMSSIGHSTVGYADKAAYDAKVREACKGLTIDGKPLGQ